MTIIYVDGDGLDAPTDAEVINTRPGQPYCHALTLDSPTDSDCVIALWALKDAHETPTERRYAH